MGLMTRQRLSVWGERGPAHREVSAVEGALREALAPRPTAEAAAVLLPEQLQQPRRHHEVHLQRRTQPRHSAGQHGAAANQHQAQSSRLGAFNQANQHSRTPWPRVVPAMHCRCVCSGGQVAGCQNYAAVPAVSG